MQKYIDNLDDFKDDSRPPIVDWVEWLLVGIFDLAGAGACAYIGYLLLRGMCVVKKNEPRRVEPSEGPITKII